MSIVNKKIGTLKINCGDTLIELQRKIIDILNDNREYTNIYLKPPSFLLPLHHKDLAVKFSIYGERPAIKKIEKVSKRM